MTNARRGKDKYRAGHRLQTRLAHLGRSPEDYHGFINPPVVRGSTILFQNAAQMKGRQGSRYEYGLTNTPLIEFLNEAMTELEGAAGCVSLISGLAAVSMSLTMAVRPGCRILVPDNVYYPTRRFCDLTMKNLGAEIVYYDPMDLHAYRELLNDDTTCVFIEAPGSITFETPDVPALVEAAKSVGAVTMMDNTWATPLIYRPLENGIDISIQAGTKYLAGHSDLLIGMVSANRDHWLDLRKIHKYSGHQAGTEETWLTLRGMRTLDVRLERHEKNGHIVADWLKGRPEVARLLHPAYPDCPGHDNWKRIFGRSCGLFGFILNGSDAMADKFFDNLKLFGLGASWGGFESLAITADLSKSRTARRWMQGPVIRLHVGLEHPDDLIADLDRAFAAMARAV